MSLLAWLRRALVTPRVTHVRTGFITDRGWPGGARVDTVCGARVHPDRTTAIDRPVMVLLAASPPQYGSKPPERWVTCPGCREAAGWPVYGPVPGSGTGVHR